MMVHSDAFGGLYEDDDESDGFIDSSSISERECQLSSILRGIEHMSDIVLQVRGLESGYSREVHGELTLTENFEQDASTVPRGFQPPFRVKLHYKTSEHQAQFFAPGSRASMI